MPEHSVIVLVESDPQLLNLIPIILRGFEVKTVGRVMDAMKLLEDAPSPPSLLIAEMVMPDASGVELAEACGSWFPGMPVLLISEDPVDACQIQDVKWNWAFISKPFTPLELVKAVSGLLR